MILAFDYICNDVIDAPTVKTGNIPAWLKGRSYENGKGYNIPAMLLAFDTIRDDTVNTTTVKTGTILVWLKWSIRYA